MKSPLVSSLVRAAFVAVMVVSVTGCATNSPKPAGCPPKYAFHYTDTARGFSLCLPNGLKKADAGGVTTFSGFAVPAGTNLQAKSLIVLTGNYDMLPGATPSGSITANGVVLKRVRADEGSAGHSTLHVIYTWQRKNGSTVHFDFTHRAVNVGVFDPQDRPKEYDKAAQLKLSEEIMGTLKTLK